MQTTESSSCYDHLENSSIIDLIKIINNEDKTVPYSIEKSLDSIHLLINSIYKRMKNGGRLFYIGSGTPGRLGIVDASECPPTYGVDDNVIIGLIAGGDNAIRKSIEKAEDNTSQAWKDLIDKKINHKDSIIGISASGRTPYVVGGIKECKKKNIFTGSIVCNKNSELSKNSDISIEVVVGPEVVTGSTRMKAGTAQKLILNMISTILMIKLGKVKGNKMIDMQLSNSKLIDRGTRIVASELDISYKEAKKVLRDNKSVRKSIEKNSR